MVVFVFVNCNSHPYMLSFAIAIFGAEVAVAFIVRYVVFLGVWLRLFFKMFFMLKYIKMMFFFIKKNLFLRSAHQNNLKHIKIIIFNQKTKKN
jgi:hypothetical protein